MEYEYQDLRFERFSLDMLMLFQFAILCHWDDFSLESGYLPTCDTSLYIQNIADHSISVTSEFYNFMSTFMYIVVLCTVLDQNKVRGNQDLKFISHNCLGRIKLFTQVQFLCAKWKVIL